MSVPCPAGVRPSDAARPEVEAFGVVVCSDADQGAVKVRDTEAKPAPKERTELDVVTWELDLAPGAKQELTLSFTIETPKNERLSGWTD